MDVALNGFDIQFYEQVSNKQKQYVDNSYTETIFKTLKLIKVNEIIKLLELKFYYKYENNLLPHYLQSLSLQINTNSYETRSQNKIVQWRPDA